MRLWYALCFFLNFVELAITIYEPFVWNNLFGAIHELSFPPLLIAKLFVLRAFNSDLFLRPARIWISNFASVANHRKDFWVRVNATTRKVAAILEDDAAAAAAAADAAAAAASEDSSPSSPPPSSRPSSPPFFPPSRPPSPAFPSSSSPPPACASLPKNERFGTFVFLSLPSLTSVAVISYLLGTRYGPLLSTFLLDLTVVYRFIEPIAAPMRAEMKREIAVDRAMDEYFKKLMSRNPPGGGPMGPPPPPPPPQGPVLTWLRLYSFSIDALERVVFAALFCIGLYLVMVKVDFGVVWKGDWVVFMALWAFAQTPIQNLSLMVAE